MDELRRQAREAVQRDVENLPGSLPASSHSRTTSLRELWQNVSTHDCSTHLKACENIYFAICVLDGWNPVLPDDAGPGPQPLEKQDAEALGNLSHWASSLTLPSSEFAAFFDESADITAEIQRSQKETRLRASLAVRFLLLLTAKGAPGTQDSSLFSSPGAIAATAIFTSEQEPWSTAETATKACMFINVACEKELPSILERLLKEKIRPLFSKSRNPAITRDGRKDLHPVPLPRFDGSVFDDATRPWKNTDIYATSLLRWIVSQYTTNAKQHLETNFPLLVPALLALIDDSSSYFKIQGCELLNQLLEVIQQNGSDILIRTNLISVFEEAIVPCLLSLPTITPEDSSLKLLGVAYPTLLSLFKTAYQTPPKRSPSQEEKDAETYKTSLAKILRSNLVSSFHHISSSTPASVSTTASFPHPRLSVLLLHWIGVFLNGLGIHTTKYLQDLVPLIYTTLSNPFGAVHPPLLLAAITTTKIIIINARPRVWRWRGEILGGLAACWLSIIREKESKEQEKDEQHGSSITDLVKVTSELQRAVSVLKLALQNPQLDSGGSIDPDQLAVKEGLVKELQQLVEADSELEDLLFTEGMSSV